MNLRKRILVTGIRLHKLGVVKRLQASFLQKLFL